MTAPLPTREEIADILQRVYEVKTADSFDRFLAMADALLARLRPALDRMTHRITELEKDWPTDADAFRVQAGISTRALAECDALRASLARKDEVLRACVEALERRRVNLASNLASEWERLTTHQVRSEVQHEHDEICATLAHPDVKDLK